MGSWLGATFGAGHGQAWLDASTGTVRTGGDGDTAAWAGMLRHLLQRGWHSPDAVCSVWDPARSEPG